VATDLLPAGDSSLASTSRLRIALGKYCISLARRVRCVCTYKLCNNYSAVFYAWVAQLLEASAPQTPRCGCCAEFASEAATDDVERRCLLSDTRGWPQCEDLAWDPCGRALGAVKVQWYQDGALVLCAMLASASFFHSLWHAHTISTCVYKARGYQYALPCCAEKGREGAQGEQQHISNVSGRYHVG